MNLTYTDLTEREKEALAEFRNMTDEQQDTCLRDLQNMLKERGPQ